jgi:hypothetical protein
VPRCVVVTKPNRFTDRRGIIPFIDGSSWAKAVKFPALLLIGELIGYYTVEISHLLHSP